MAGLSIAPTPAPAPAGGQAPADTSLFAKPGESILDYETRLGSSNQSTPGQGFGTPQPVAAKLVPPSQGGTQGEPESTDPLGSAQDAAAIAAGYTSYQDAVSKLTAPSQDTTDFYNNAYQAAGLDQLQQQINQKNSDLNTALGTINDNPWLDEADRLGRSKTVQTLAQGDIKNLTAQYAAGLKNVNTLVSNHSKDVSASDASNKAKLAFLEAQAKAQAAQTTAQTKAANTAPKTIKGANGATFEWDPATGNFNQILPGKAGTGSTSGFAFTAKQLTALQSQGLDSNSANGILSDIKSGQSLEAIREQMKASGLDPGLLDSLMYYVDPKNNTPKKTTTKASTAPAVIPGISLSGSIPALA
jgi:hypothetical protein